MADHHHHHHEPTGTRLADAARVTLEAQSEQWTPMRAAIFDALAAEEKPASAYDIADTVSKARGKRVAPNSVYRILDLFVTNNIAMRATSRRTHITRGNNPFIFGNYRPRATAVASRTHANRPHNAEKIFVPGRPLIF